MPSSGGPECAREREGSTNFVGAFPKRAQIRNDYYIQSKTGCNSSGFFLEKAVHRFQVCNS